MLSAGRSMDAQVLLDYGAGLHRMRLPRPDPEAGQVRVRIMASGVNPLDVKIRRGTADHAQTQLPAVLGLDLAGVVDAVAPGVHQFEVGDEVFGLTGGVAGIQGSLAEFAAVDADLLALKPANFTMRQAASMPLVFITAWEGLVDRAGVQPTDKVLVHGGAGGVGHMVVQLARANGAAVFATGTALQAQVIERLGATAIDFATADSRDYVRTYTADVGFDIIFDTVGGATLDQSLSDVRRYTGHVVSTLGWGTHNLAPLSFRGATYSGVFALMALLTGEGRAHHAEILRAATELAEAGKVTPVLDPRHFTLDSAHDAHAAIQDGSATGRIVVEIPD